MMSVLLFVTACLTVLRPMEVMMSEVRFESLINNNNNTVEYLHQIAMNTWPDWILTLLTNYAYCKRHNIKFTGYSMPFKNHIGGGEVITKLRIRPSETLLHLESNSYFAQPDVSPAAFIQLMSDSGSCNNIEKSTAMSDYSVIKGRVDTVELWNLRNLSQAQMVASICVNGTATSCSDTLCRLCMSSFATTCSNTFLGSPAGRFVKTLPDTVSSEHRSRTYVNAMVAAADIHYKEEALYLLKEVIDTRSIRRLN